MKRLLVMITAAVFSVFALVAVSSAAFPSISNGSFETGTNPGGFTTLFAGNNTSIPGWTVSAGSVDYIGTYWQASDGVRSIDLNGNSTGAISQSFSTIGGLTYNVTFAMSGNPAGAPVIKTMTADAGGVPSIFSYDTSTGPATLADMKWTSKSFSFTATSTTTTLTFASTILGFYGPALDNVRVVEATPGNADDCKKGGWQHLSDGQGHLFKNQGDCVSFVATQGKNLGAITP